MQSILAFLVNGVDPASFALAAAFSLPIDGPAD
ncbi:hypothetical protein ACVWZA_001051 [Sphingomonas sp. UYAg733]